MASMLVVIKSDGTSTRPMAQAQAESYLTNLLVREKHANLKQVMNDVFGDGSKQKASGSYQFNGRPILHASSGNGQSSVTGFFYVIGSTAYLVALGEHKTSSSYYIATYGQTSGDFKHKATITL